MNNLNIPCEQIRHAIKLGAQMIDVRTPQEYSQDALPNAINVPVQQLAANLCLIDADRPALLYCGSGQRSEMATQILQEQGFSNVMNIGAHVNYQTCYNS